MNARNVDAIYRVIAHPPPEWADWLVRPDPQRALAEYLASQGALMPEALTDDDWTRLYHSVSSMDSNEESAEVLRRIATGETADGT